MAKVLGLKTSSDPRESRGKAGTTNDDVVGRYAGDLSSIPAIKLYNIKKQSIIIIIIIIERKKKQIHEPNGFLCIVKNQ